MEYFVCGVCCFCLKCHVVSVAIVIVVAGIIIIISETNVVRIIFFHSYLLVSASFHLTQLLTGISLGEMRSEWMCLFGFRVKHVAFHFAFTSEKVTRVMALFVCYLRFGSRSSSSI